MFENFIRGATTERKTAQVTIQLWFNYFRSIFLTRHLAYALAMRPK